MSDSENDTVALTPRSVADELANPVVDNFFAWIRPHSPTACAAFDAIVNACIREPEKYKHTRKFLHTDDHRGERVSSPFTDDGQDQESASRRQWSGAYKLALKDLPHDPMKGWYLGSDYSEADLALAPSSNTWRSKTRIDGRHAKTLPTPRVLQSDLEARHTLTTTNSGAKVLRALASRVLGHGELIAINDCCYTFELTGHFTTPEFAEALSVFMKIYHGVQWSMNKLLSPISVGQPLSIGKYYCSPSAFAQGSYAKVSAGWTKDGSAIAVKVFKNPKKTDIRSHELMMQYIGKHDNILQLLDCVYHFDTDVPDAYSVYAPLGVASLTRLIGKYIFDADAKLTLVIDYLNGLSYLNDTLHVTHRDINPNNLAVTSFDNPKGIILDLDAAISTEFSTDHMAGTITYLAPEIIRLKDLEPHQVPVSYNKSVDIWALGLSVFELQSSQRVWWGLLAPRGSKRSEFVTFDLHAELHRNIARGIGAVQDGRGKSLLELVMQMTEWDDRDRISPTKALVLAKGIKGDGDRKGTIVLRGPVKRPLPD